MPGKNSTDGFHGLARLTIELSEGRTAQAEPLARALYEMSGPLPTDAWVVTLAAAGRAGEARGTRYRPDASGRPARRGRVGGLAMQPVAQTPGELSAFLGRPQEAVRHFTVAQQVARRWNSPHWAARARAAASLCPPNG
jgi:hypothetical protein